MDGDDRGHVDIGDAKDLVDLVGLEADRLQRRGERIAAVPQTVRTWPASASG
jgi:hypothetical protein